MTNATIDRIPECFEILKGVKEKIVVTSWEAKGHRYVSVGIQILTPTGDYVFQRGRSFGLRPAEARELAHALTSMAAVVNGSPEDPVPSEEDRELSRMP